MYAPEPLPQRHREVLVQILDESRILGQVAGEDLGHVGVLRVGDQHRELGRGEAGPGRLALGDLLVRRQELEPAVEPAFALELRRGSGRGR